MLQQVQEVGINIHHLLEKSFGHRGNNYATQTLSMQLLNGLMGSCCAIGMLQCNEQDL